MDYNRFTDLFFMGGVLLVADAPLVDLVLEV